MTASDDDMIRRGDAIAALRSADLPFGYGHAAEVIRAVPAVQVAVKPLEWETFSTECERAFTVAGRYEVFWGFRSGQVCLDMRGRTTWHCGIEAAKAAAQADYEARIRSTLTAQPSPDVAALVALMPEVIASLDATNCNISLVRDLRAALARVKGGDA